MELLRGDRKPMPDRTYNRESGIDATRASARLPGLDIDIIHRQSPNGDWEQMSINIRAAPSFEAVGRLFEAADPFHALGAGRAIDVDAVAADGADDDAAARPAANTPECRMKMGAIASRWRKAIVSKVLPTP
jgi:hypothetical protein